MRRRTQPNCKKNRPRLAEIPLGSICHDIEVIPFVSHGCSVAGSGLHPVAKRQAFTMGCALQPSGCIGAYRRWVQPDAIPVSNITTTRRQTDMPTPLLSCQARFAIDCLSMRYLSYILVPVSLISALTDSLSSRVQPICRFNEIVHCFNARYHFVTSLPIPTWAR